MTALRLGTLGASPGNVPKPAYPDPLSLMPGWGRSDQAKAATIAALSAMTKPPRAILDLNKTTY